MHTETTIRNWLKTIKDPEIPVLSIADLGIIREITVANDQVKVIITPTFVGCPALDTIKSEIVQTLKEKKIERVTVEVSYKHTWSTNDITAEGKNALKNFGLAPAPEILLSDDITIVEYAVCPRCNGNNTELKSAFGATLCRSIHYCHDCKESFEQMKPL